MNRAYLITMTTDHGSNQFTHTGWDYRISDGYLTIYTLVPRTVKGFFGKVDTVYDSEKTLTLRAGTWDRIEAK